jgi:hypothetical protein
MSPFRFVLQTSALDISLIPCSEFFSLGGKDKPQKKKPGILNRRQLRSERRRLSNNTGLSKPQDRDLPITQHNSHGSNHTVSSEPPTLQPPQFQHLECNYISEENLALSSQNSVSGKSRSEWQADDDKVDISGGRSTGQKVPDRQHDHTAEIVASNPPHFKQNAVGSKARVEQPNSRSYGLSHDRDSDQGNYPRSRGSTVPNLYPDHGSQSFSKDNKPSGAGSTDAITQFYKKERQRRINGPFSITRKAIGRTKEGEDGNLSSSSAPPDSNLTNSRRLQHPRGHGTTGNDVHQNQSSRDGPQNELDQLVQSNGESRKKAEAQDDGPQNHVLSQTGYNESELAIRNSTEIPQKFRGEQEEDPINSHSHPDGLRKALNILSTREDIDCNLDLAVLQGSERPGSSQKLITLPNLHSLDDIEQSSRPHRLDEAQANTSHSLDNTFHSPDDLISSESISVAQREALLDIYDMVHEVKLTPTATPLDDEYYDEVLPTDVKKAVAKFLGTSRKDLEDANAVTRGLAEEHRKAREQEVRLKTEHEKEKEVLKGQISRIEEEQRIREEKSRDDVFSMTERYAGKISAFELKAFQLTEETEAAKKETEAAKKNERVHMENSRKTLENYERTKAEVENLAKVITQLEVKEGILRKEHEAQQKNLQDDFRIQKAQDLKEVQREKDQEIQRLQGVIEVSKEREKTTAKEHYRACEALKLSFSTQWDVNMQKIETENAERMKQLGDKISALELELGNAKEVHRNEVGRLEAQISSMRSDFDIEKEASLKLVKADNEAFKKELVRRKHMKGMSDFELASCFHDLADEVEHFARVDWDKTMQGAWPFPQNAFRASRNEVQLKRHVIQSKIWCVLWDGVFYTPFRIFGEEGRSMDSKWTRSSQGSCFNGSFSPLRLLNCPDPSRGPIASEDVENWRCKEVKGCRDAIQQSEPHAKESYQRALMAVAKDLSAVLGSVSSVDSRIRTEMKKLAEKAAELWLKVGIQRFRVIVLMSDPNKTSLQGREVRMGKSKEPRELVIRPEMRRIGNSQEEELDREHVISDCRGIYTDFESG